MKILILSNKLPYPPKDGGSIATLNMLTGLRDAGNQVTCLSLNTSKHPYPIEDIPSEIGETIRFMGVACNTSIKPLSRLISCSRSCTFELNSSIRWASCLTCLTSRSIS